MTTVSVEARLVFIHVPKTGGTTVKHLLESRLSAELGFRRHADVSEVIAQRPEAKNFFKFAFVRNPWDLQHSMYNYIMQFSLGHSEKAGVEAAGSFDKYITTYIWQRWQQGKIHDQISQLTDADGAIIMDSIGRFERFGDDLQAIFLQRQLPPPENIWLNRSEHAHYGLDYSDDAKSVIEIVYRRDIERFGYIFQG